MDKRKEPSSIEIQEAIEYLRGERDKPSSEIEWKRKDLEKQRNFAGCLVLLLGMFVVGCIGGLASGHIGGGLVLLSVAMALGYLLKAFRDSMRKQSRELEEMKREKWNEKANDAEEV